MENFKLSVNDDDNHKGGVTIEISTRFSLVGDTQLSVSDYICM